MGGPRKLLERYSDCARDINRVELNLAKLIGTRNFLKDSGGLLSRISASVRKLLTSIQIPLLKWKKVNGKCISILGNLFASIDVLEIKYSKLQDEYNTRAMDHLIHAAAKQWELPKDLDTWEAAFHAATLAFSSNITLPKPPKEFPKQIRELLQDLVLGTFSMYEKAGYADFVLMQKSPDSSYARFEWGNLREWLEAKKVVGSHAVSILWESAKKGAAALSSEDIFGSVDANDVVKLRSSSTTLSRIFLRFYPQGIKGRTSSF